ncbi:dihydrolipoyl dehydrogenase family protein [Salinibacter altiplanensis]|uniref:dihydrolipoyl dehydrogenase family protein n=1 Tax=Salinibacter altiplanensis TaxID=1803181 RepID=UPI000C9F6A8A|nr:NAD(P)/FAD-dependent oxidoreductase [Salinibacter altiplanensis]
MPDTTYDLVVIGTGSGGAPAAFRCAADGWSVAIVDERPYGGTCAVRGCDPKKVLIGGAQLTDWSRRMQGHGVDGDLQVDWPALMDFKRSFTEPVPDDRKRRFHAKGIDTFDGTARFVADDAIEVGGETLGFEHLLLANGAKPTPLPIGGAEHLTTSTEFLELDALPDRLAFVGGGYISFEFAHLAARAGADVTIVHRGPRPLENFDSDLAEPLAEHTRDLGITLHLGTEVTAIEKHEENVLVRATQNGQTLSIEADRAVHGAGRVPRLDEIDLETGGIEATRHGVSVDEHLQSTGNSRVWAAGDAADTPGLPLTPVATMESLTVASNLRGGGRTPNYDGIPTVVFTIPPMASVGHTEAEAREQGIDASVRYKSDITGWYSYERLAADVAAFKVVVEEDTDRIVGAHVLGERAEEVINLFALAIRHGISASELRHGVYAYPTHASDLPHMV